MNRQVERVSNAVLYEGYVLYPYRPAMKNQQRWTFGSLYPRAYSEAGGGADPWTAQTQCLLEGDDQTRIEVRVRFLHLVRRTIGELLPPGAGQATLRRFRPVESLRVDDRLVHGWQEAVEREAGTGQLGLSELVGGPAASPFDVAGSSATEPLVESSGRAVGVVLREQQAVAGAIEVCAERLEDGGVLRVTASVCNCGELATLPGATSRDDALLRSIVSAQLLLTARGGQFCSMVDPPERWRQPAAACRQAGLWPVLVGEPGRRDTMLAAPIILYDYPQVAEQSPGDLFDATEIDEMLTLRIQTLTDDEKREARDLDERVDVMLQRAERMTREQLMGLHGTIREFRTPEDRG